MRRRSFLQKAAVATLGLPLMQGFSQLNLFARQTGSVVLPKDELQTALESYFGKYFRGEMLNQNETLPDGRIMFSKGFKIVTMENKNTVFDIADLIIEHCDKVGFDAGSLINGKIPENMNIGLGRIGLVQEKKLHAFKVDELVNYDAILIAEKPINIKTHQPPSKWQELGRIKKERDTSMMELFRDRKKVITIKKTKLDFESRIAVNSLNPNLVFAPGHKHRVPVSFDVGKNYFTPEINNLLFNS